MSRNANCQTITCNGNKKCLKDGANGSEARCVTCPPMPCPAGRPHVNAVHKHSAANKVLCASNNITYWNWCSMMSDACSTGIYLHVVSGGPCPTNHVFHPIVRQEYLGF
ncbi:unnamed protein product [Oppiella nova]|uniref:Kazal-like domain-containing protein n=1 Tax=Oppiella nova TaxID=334625 RepID=A0A7R9M9F3_9ACAR|nr:unnamed protein product [Oppiella nova]CAG2172957.1 unnamed protein product [Oppiella nova]